jgi:hypothetical protein
MPRIKTGGRKDKKGHLGGDPLTPPRRTRTRRLRRDVKELENRWRTKWRVDGITKNRELRVCALGEVLIVNRSADAADQDGRAKG